MPAYYDNWREATYALLKSLVPAESSEGVVSKYSIDTAHAAWR
jgi:hypothetical protein